MLLADDHAMVREGMAEMISASEGMEVVGTAGDGQEALALAERTKPDVAILDVEMPVMGAQVALRKMLALSPPPRVVIVTVFADARLVRELLALGASAYLSKSAPMQTLLETVRSVASDGDEDDVIVSMPRQSFAAPGGTEAGHRLTRREKEVIMLVARGMSNRRVSERLNLSETTVKRHLSGVYRKLGVASRGEAVGKAISEGWISPQDVSRGD